MGGGHDEHEQTLNQLLVEMDGFEPNETVILVAATNKLTFWTLPYYALEDSIDVSISNPDVKGRKTILEVRKKDPTQMMWN